MKKIEKSSQKTRANNVDFKVEEERIETRIPESQGDIADRSDDEIENDIRWRVELIRRASREDDSRRAR